LDKNYKLIVIKELNYFYKGVSNRVLKYISSFNYYSKREKSMNKITILLDYLRYSKIET